jgi:endonuclease G
MARVQPADYARSGYDRGHLAPNLALALWHGAEAQRQSFLMSNVVPQRPTLNAGLWRRMEERMARNYPARFEEVWIICGPVHAAPPARLRPGGVAIPDSFFLIVLDETDGRWRAQAFLVPQDADGAETWERFRTSIDAIERRVGFDFLAGLPDAVEGPLEAAVAGRPW